MLTALGEGWRTLRVSRPPEAACCGPSRVCHGGPGPVAEAPDRRRHGQIELGLLHEESVGQTVVGAGLQLRSRQSCVNRTVRGVRAETLASHGGIRGPLAWALLLRHLRLQPGEQRSGPARHSCSLFAALFLFFVRETERERQVCPLVYSPMSVAGPGHGREPGSPSWSPTWVRGPSSWAILLCLPRSLGSRIRSSPAL